MSKVNGLLINAFFYLCSDKTERDTMYETPPPKYSAERILKILLDPSLPTSKVCSVRPTNIFKSSTYVIDISKLEHPDDDKNDNFGTWKHSGSHPLGYTVQVENNRGLYIEKCAPGAVGEDVVYLCRLYSVYPSNSNLKRLLSQVGIYLHNTNALGHIHNNDASPCMCVACNAHSVNTALIHTTQCR